MVKQVLVDTNVFIHYSEGQKYALTFFSKARYSSEVQIHVLKDVYAEARVMSLDFQKIYNLITELQKCQIYHKVELEDSEREYAEELTQKCFEELGHAIDRTDRRIIAVAKMRKLEIFSKDKDLIRIARLEGIKTL
ncbi:MAG: PIN domain-containing protein [Candidatus Nanoarchaeia archaeon]|nr:PIN domain-containing protein [Candidatus Nanoarchaeia archaeon]MDD5239565.1 PIN domain-containing protein [Candidatus Nanoarchaeia archaeon]